MVKFLLALVCLVGPVAAHDLYLMPSSFFVSSGERITVAIHEGDSFPNSEAAVPLARLRDTDLITPSAVYNITNLRVDGSTVTAQANIRLRGTLILTARTMPNLIEVEPQKFRDYLTKNGQTDALHQHPPEQAGRERYSEYAKTLIQSEAADDFFSHVVGFMIEIVPEKNPYTLHAGDELPVQVLVRGKPAPDLQIEAVRAQSGPSPARLIGRTDATGHVTIPINGAGKWRLHAVSMHKCSDPTLAECWESFWASLTFEIR
jgi:uncharacterized GH25 family protein